MTIMQQFIDNLRRIQRQRGMTQTEFARLLGMHQPGLSKLYSGTWNVTLEKAAEIANRLDIPLEELISDKISKILQ